MGVIQKQTIKGSVWSYVGAFLGFVNTGLLFPKIFSTSEIGLLSVLVAISALFSQFSSLGMNSVTARLFPYFKENIKSKSGYLSLLLIVTIIGFVVSILVGLIFQDWIVETNNDESGLMGKYAIYLIPMTLFTLFFNVFDTYNKMLYDITSGIFLKEFVLRVLNFISIILFFFNVIDFDVFVFLYVLSYFVPLGVLLVILFVRGEIVVNLKGFLLPKAMKREIFLVAAFGILAGFSGIVIDYLDKFLVGKYLGLSEAGIYTIIFFIGGMILLPFRALNKISSTLIAECWKENNLSTIEDIYKKSSLSQFLFGIFLFCLLVLNFSNIFEFLPEQYSIGKWAMLVIAASNVLIMISGVSYAIISTAKYYWYMTLLMGLQIVMVIVCNVLLISVFGMIGAAFASFVSVIFIRIGSILIVGRKSKIWPFTLNHLKVLIVSTVSIALAFAVPDIKNYILDSVVKSFIFSIAFLILILRFNVSTDLENALLLFKDNLLRKRYLLLFKILFIYKKINMAERAHPDTFKDKWFGLKKNKYRHNLVNRYNYCNDYIKGKVVLDIPCGMGWGTSMLKGFQKIYGIDIASDAIEEAKSRYPEISFSVGNMTKIDFPDNSFDVVICLEGFEHVTYLEGQNFLKEAKRVLKPEGTLILSTPLLIDEKLHSGNRYHLCEYKREELFDTIRNHSFNVLDKKEFSTSEGSIMIILALKSNN